MTGEPSRTCHTWTRTRASIGRGFLILAVTSLTCIAAGGNPSDNSRDTADKGGTVWTWGGNIYGELGHEKRKLWSLWSPVLPEVRDLQTPAWLLVLWSGRYVPAPIPEVGMATEVAADTFNSMALDAGGSVWTWGLNDRGQLGIGSKSTSGLPSRVPNLEGVRAIAAGHRLGVALMKDGTVRTWGENYAGELGDGTTEEKASPVRVLGISDVKAIDAGHGFAVALKHDGTVWAWGYNGYGALGDGTKEDRTTPVKMVGLDHVKAIACGDYMTMALKEDGTVWGCGNNYCGSLGDGTETDRTVPVQIEGVKDVAAIACGESMTLAIRSDSTVWAWGHGELGLENDATPGRRGGDDPKRNTPAQIPRLRNIKAVAAGATFFFAVERDGTLWACGCNWGGEFGVKEPRESFVPVEIPGISGIEKIACGVQHVVAIRSNPPAEELKETQGKE